MSRLPEGPYMDWRAFLQTSEVDVFQTIENAILIAATDFPGKFLDKKDDLMQTMITSTQSCESLLKYIIVSGPMEDESAEASENNTTSDVGKRNIEEGEIVEYFSEDDKKDEKEEHEENFNDDMNFNTFVKKRKTDVACANSDDNAESSLNNAVTTGKEVCTGTLVAKEVKMEGEDLTVENDVAKSVLRIKNVLLAMKHQPAVIAELLKKLDTMDISFEVLQATGIAGVVSSFKTKDYTIEIRQLVEVLMEDWEIVFDEWIAQDSNALPDPNEFKVENVNEVALAKPKSLIGAGFSSMTRAGSFALSQDPLEPPQVQPLFSTGSRDPATSIDEVTIAANKHAPKSSRKARPPRTKRSVSLKYSEGPPKHQSSEPSVSIRSTGPANERRIVDGQTTKMYPLINRQPARTSGVRIGDSSRGNNNTFLTRQPRHQLQGPILTMEKRPDAENKKMKVPAPAEKIEEDSVKESLQIAKRKLQERLQKSQQAKRPDMAPQSGEKDTSIGELLSQYRRGPY